MSTGSRRSLSKRDSNAVKVLERRWVGENIGAHCGLPGFGNHVTRAGEDFSF